MLLAQSNYSFYNRYGLGLLSPSSFSEGLADASEYDLRLVNPAVLSNLTLTGLSIGAQLNQNWANFQGNSTFQPAMNFHHLAFSFPIVANRWGTSFAFLPYSSADYEYTTSEGSSAEFQLAKVQGLGGVAQVTWQQGWLLRPNFSFGLGINYLFSGFSRTHILNFPNLVNSLATRLEDRTSLNAFKYDLGLLYTRHLSENLDLNLAFTYSPRFAMNFEKDNLRTSYEQSTETVYDTLFFGRTKNKQNIADAFAFGWQLKKENAWQWHTDMSFQDWSKFSYNAPQEGFVAQYLFSSVFTFLPKANPLQYSQSMRYHLGSKFQRHYIRLNGDEVLDWSFLFGFSMPLKYNKEVPQGHTVFHFNFTYGLRGFNRVNLIKENYFNLLVYVTVNEKWFKKRKID
ncbi:MAG: hypothetical protein ACKO7P_03285 [Bacteroidota bacterium]